MRPTPPKGDLVLTARPASADTFAPFGQLLGVGDHVRLGRRGSALAMLDEGRPGPRRFTHLQRCPEARRLLLPLGDVPLLVVVLGPGDPPAGPPAAFRIAPEQGLLVGAGVWHAGPFALEKGVVCEILETRGPVDRFDRRPLSELAGVEAIRVQLPEEPGAAGPGIDLDAPGAVLVEEGLAGRLAVGLLLLADLEIPREHPALTAEIEQVGKALRSLRGRHREITGLFGVAEIRRLWRALGLDPATRLPTYETGLREVLEGRPPPAADALEGAVGLCSLRRPAIGCIHDPTSLTAPLQLRYGRKAESLEDEAGRPVDAEGLPVLCDRDGPFAGPVGEVRRVRIAPGATRALVVLYLPAGTEEAQVLTHLEEVSRAALTYCGGREAGRLALP